VHLFTMTLSSPRMDYRYVRILFVLIRAAHHRVSMRCIFFFFPNLPNRSGRTMALGSTQPITEMSTRNLKTETWGVKGGRRVGLTTFPPSVRRLSKGASTLLILVLVLSRLQQQLRCVLLQAWRARARVMWTRLKKCGSLDLSEPFGPPRAVTGISLPLSRSTSRWYQ
jgi:hypothetical protein